MLLIKESSVISCYELALDLYYEIVCNTRKDENRCSCEPYILKSREKTYECRYETNGSKEETVCPVKAISRLEDELTRLKRELVSHKRVINDFFLGSNALFEQMENSYQAYARYMSEQSRKIVPQLGDMFATSAPEHIVKPEIRPRETEKKIEETVIDVMPDTKLDEPADAVRPPEQQSDKAAEMAQDAVRTESRVQE